MLLIFSIHGSGSFQGIARVTDVLSTKPARDYVAPGLAANFAVEWVKKLVLFLHFCFTSHKIGNCKFCEL